MAETAEDEELFWVDPQRRGILPLDGLHVPRRLARSFLAGGFEIAVDRDFAGVVAACADRPETWINGRDRPALPRPAPARPRAFGRDLAGRARSRAGSTAWRSAARSSARACSAARRDASKFALIALVARLRAGGFRLLDTQFVTDHLARLGAVEIGRAAYHRRLQAALAQPARFLALAADASRQSLLQLTTQTS